MVDYVKENFKIILIIILIPILIPLFIKYVDILLNAGRFIGSFIRNISNLYI